MGSWGFDVLADDFARDVYGDFMDLFNDGGQISAIGRALKRKFSEVLEYPDEGPVFWFALAWAQWRVGSLEPAVLQRASEIIKLNKGLERWEEAGASALEKRRAALRRFLNTIQVPNPKPLKPRKPKKHFAIYEPGDCLAIRLSDGDWGAALVLAADNSDRVIGKNLVGLLKYKNENKPALSIFEKRKWLILTHHQWDGKPEITWYLASLYEQSDADKIEKVGRITLRQDDPKSSDTIAGGWSLWLQVEFQHEWDRGIRG